MRAERRAYPVPSGLVPAVTPNSGTSAGSTSRRIRGSEWTEAAMAAPARRAVENFMMLIVDVLRSVGKAVQLNSRVGNGGRKRQAWRSKARQRQRPRYKGTPGVKRETDVPAVKQKGMRTSLCAAQRQTLYYRPLLSSRRNSWLLFPPTQRRPTSRCKRRQGWGIIRSQRSLRSGCALSSRPITSHISPVHLSQSIIWASHPRAMFVRLLDQFHCPARKYVPPSVPALSILSTILNAAHSPWPQTEDPSCQA